MKKLVFAAVVVCAASAFAETYTWNGSTSTDWAEPANWTPNGMPGAGDAIVIANVATKPILPAGRWPASGSYLSLTVDSGATLTCAGDRSYINEESGGTTTYPLGRGVDIFCDDATIAGNLSANEQGLLYKTNDGAGHGGRSHWGAGGLSDVRCLGYGFISHPTALGMGGRYGNAGGGAIRLTATGTVNVSGTISANAGGLNAGGSIWVRAGTLTGSGKISANAAGNAGGCGGGGRVALESATDSFTGTITVNTTWCSGYDRRACPGTVFRSAGVPVSSYDGSGISIEANYKDEILTSDLMPNTAETIVNGQAMLCTRTVTKWDVDKGTFNWDEKCVRAVGGNLIENAVTSTMRGLTAGASYSVLCGAESLGTFVADEDGVIAFTAPLASAAGHSISVSDLSKVEYLEIADYTVANPTTGSTAFSGSSPLAIAAMAAVDGADRWMLTEGGTIDDMRAGNWTVSPVLPKSQTFTPRDADADLLVYAWFGNSTDSSYVPRRAKAPFRFTVAKPVVSVRAELSRGMRGIAGYCLSVDEYDTGTVGGSSSGEGLETRTIPLFARALEVVSGPGADLDDDPTTVTLNVEGDYVLRFTAMNDAGNTAFEDVAFNLFDVPAGSTLSWIGGTGADWNAPGSWDQGVLPQDGDHIVIPASSKPNIPAGIWPASGAYGSFTVEKGATATCKGDLSTTEGSGVTIKAGTISILGELSANGQGFGNNAGPGAGSSACGHGGPACSCVAALGTAHSYAASQIFASAYGSFAEPTSVGSGRLANGGGAIHLVASGTLTVDGTVTANGSSASSGGSIWLECETFAGAGSVSANGGPGNSGWMPAGGRVAIYHTSCTYTGKRSVSGGQGSLSCGAEGTLYEPGLFPTGTKDAPASVTLSENFHYVFADETTPHYWNLTVANGTRAWLSRGKLHLGDLTLSGSAQLYLGDETYTQAPGNFSEFSISSIALNDTSLLMLPGGAIGAAGYDLTSLTIASGAVLKIGAGDFDDINEEAGGTKAKPLGRGTVIRVPSLNLAGVISAWGSGFYGARGPYPGNVTGGTSHGGISSYVSSGYGLLSAPTELGCGYSQGFGGSDTTRGGGALLLEVPGTLTLDGAIYASSGHSYGSAGSIWVRAGTFAGAGSLVASTPDSQRVAGGGRIAIESANDTFTGVCDVHCGTVQGTNAKAYPGTIFRSAGPLGGAIGFADKPQMIARYAKGSNDAGIGYYNNSNALVVERTVTSWGRQRYAWSETCSTEATGAIANTATYAFKNLRPGARCTFTANGEVVPDPATGKDYWQVADDGALVLPAQAISGSGDSFVLNVRRAGLIFIIR